MNVAPLEKEQALKKLDVADLKGIFGGIFGSCDYNLQSFLQNRFEGQIGSLTFGDLIMPCVFQATNAATIVYAARSAATNPISRQLYYSDAVLQTKPKEWPEAVQNIKRILDGLKSYNPQDMDWSPAYYAGLAVEASLRTGNPAQAKAILLRGLQLEPDSEQLAYLSRILIREGILQPAELAPFTKASGKLKLTN